MSNPGLSTSQLTPELLQQWQQQQDVAKQQAMAQALMGNQAQGQYSGLANAGGDILGAMASNSIAAKNDPLSPVKVTPQVGTTGLGRAANLASNLFGMGGQ